MSTFERILGSAVDISERVFWVLVGALVDYGRQVYTVAFKSRWGWLYAVLLVIVIVILLSTSSR